MATGYSHAPSKVAKSINKRKGPGSQHALHANSRDARRLARVTQRDEKLARRSVLRSRVNHKYISRVVYFKVAAQDMLREAASSNPSGSTPIDLQAASSIFTASRLGRLVKSFFTRHGTTSQDQPQRKGRPVQISAQEKERRDAVQDDIEEARSGFWIPNLGDVETLKYLLERWDGEWSSLGNMKFVRVRLLSPTAAAASASASMPATGDEVKEANGMEGVDGGEASDVRVTESSFPPRAAS